MISALSGDKLSTMDLNNSKPVECSVIPRLLDSVHRIDPTQESPNYLLLRPNLELSLNMDLEPWKVIAMGINLGKTK